MDYIDFWCLCSFFFSFFLFIWDGTLTSLGKPHHTFFLFFVFLNFLEVRNRIGKNICKIIGLYGWTCFSKSFLHSFATHSIVNIFLIWHWWIFWEISQLHSLISVKAFVTARMMLFLGANFWTEIKRFRIRDHVIWCSFVRKLWFLLYSIANLSYAYHRRWI